MVRERRLPRRIVSATSLTLPPIKVFTLAYGIIRIAIRFVGEPLLAQVRQSLLEL